MEQFILNSLKKHEELLNRIESKIESPKRVLTFDEAVKFTGFSKSYLYKLTASGIVPFAKPNGKTIFFDKELLEDWLLSRSSKGSVEIERESLRYISFSNKKGGRHV